MGGKLISVIIPAYNHAHFIEETIRSIIAQTYENVELVILNDGSKDNTTEVVKSLQSECLNRFTRFEYIDKDNEGVTATLNKGLDWSRGEYVSLFASDDVMKPTRIEELFSALVDKDDSYAIAIGDAEFIDDDSNIIGMREDGSYCHPSEGFSRFLGYFTRRRSDIAQVENIFDYDLLIKGNYIPGMSVVMRKKALEDLGRYNPKIALEDWDLWLRMSRSYKGVYINKSFSYYRMHKTNSVKTMVPKLLEGQVFVLLRELGVVGDKKEYRNLLSRWIRADSFRLVKRKKYKYIKYMFSIKLLLKSYF
jgi:alpha-1,3-rhamnosyltransferase